MGKKIEVQIKCYVAAQKVVAAGFIQKMKSIKINKAYQFKVTLHTTGGDVPYDIKRVTIKRKKVEGTQVVGFVAIFYYGDLTAVKTMTDTVDSADLVITITNDPGEPNQYPTDWNVVGVDEDPDSGPFDPVITDPNDDILV